MLLADAQANPELREYVKNPEIHIPKMLEDFKYDYFPQTPEWFESRPVSYRNAQLLAYVGMKQPLQTDSLTVSICEDIHPDVIPDAFNNSVESCLINNLIRKGRSGSYRLTKPGADTVFEMAVNPDIVAKRRDNISPLKSDSVFKILDLLQNLTTERSGIWTSSYENLAFYVATRTQMPPELVRRRLNVMHTADGYIGVDRYDYPASHKTIKRLFITTEGEQQLIEMESFRRQQQGSAPSDDSVYELESLRTTAIELANEIKNHEAVQVLREQMEQDHCAELTLTEYDRQQCRLVAQLERLRKIRIRHHRLQKA